MPFIRMLYIIFVVYLHTWYGVGRGIVRRNSYFFVSFFWGEEDRELLKRGDPRVFSSPCTVDHFFLMLVLDCVRPFSARRPGSPAH